MLSDNHFLLQAISISRTNVESGRGGPFGAVITRNGKIVSEGYNQVTGLNDPTAHAEIMAIRNACTALGTFDLSSCVLYSSCEPCPMCLSAAYWARIDKVIYSNSRHDAAEIGFNDVLIYDELQYTNTQKIIQLKQISLPQSKDPFKLWLISKVKRPY
jgi:tRNA(Arg) A34 adenosine deaminase TadA